MLHLRRSHERGHADHGWLVARHTFSFADYYDPAHMGYRSLRVINEDKVQPAMGFPTHGHRDMEIVTWVLEGELKHEDSMGNGSVIRPGEAQYMSAGRGVLHSEFNASKQDRVHLLQIWIQPSKAGETPRYGQKDFSQALERGGFVPVATTSGRDGSLAIRQDAELLVARLDGAMELEHVLRPGRHAWVQVARGALEVNGVKLEQGDGLAVEAEPRMVFGKAKQAEVLVFDLA
ncbi:MAG: pirin family protein [Planctomycetes bacterium]|nr:pirin family protein [Planctomycetota bacterium]